ncbi:MAG TPA: SurA N-terminal domain-containing protein [Terriglobales bacterium]|nr:SurA N-terminal domain-containing protein [Terriglobales bacterium]
MNANAPFFGSRILRAAGIVALGVFLGISGCGRKDTPGDVMAEVNGKKIPRSEVDKWYKRQVGQVSEQQKPSTEQEASLRLNILDVLIHRQIELQRAEKLGLVTTDDEVEAKLNEMKSSYTEEQFQEELKKQGQALDDLKRDIRDNLTIQKLLNKEVNSKITISDADLTNYYNSHKAEFNRVEPGYDIAQIIVYTQAMPGASKPATDLDPRRRIQTIYNRLQSGEDFSSVAARYSEHADTASSGGRMGIIPESGVRQMDAATRDALLKMKPGDMTGIIAVINPASGQPAGYRIVKLLGKEPAGQRDLNDPRVQQFIREQLKTRREQLLTAAYRETLRNDAKVENYYAEQILKNTAASK